MNEKLIELAKAAGFVVTKRREILAKDTSFTDITHNLSSFAKLVREDERKNELQPISTAPKDGSDILLYRSTGKACWIGYWTEMKHKGWKLRGENTIVHPTHWQPLPAPPQESEAQDDTEV